MSDDQANEHLVGDPNATYVVLSVTQWDEMRSYRKNIFKAAIGAFAALILSICGIAYLVNEGTQEERARKEAAQHLRTVVESVERQTSPERQQEQAAAIDEIIVRVGCENRAAIEEAINELAEQLPITPVIVTDNCPKDPTP